MINFMNIGKNNEGTIGEVGEPEETG